jgi:tetratricopeptide (TPR) repeat protein
MESESAVNRTIGNDRQKLLMLGLCLLLIASIVALYGQTAVFDFIDLDDPSYVINNSKVTDGLTLGGIKWAFTTTYQGYWAPMTWLSLMLNREFFGMGAGGFHLVNVGLHISNTVLLFLLLKRCTKTLWLSFFAAALFGLHPLRVESVVWITERKDVLSVLFGMLTILAYLRYIEQRTVPRYVTILVLFSFGLMAKPMLVTLPFVLFLMDYWPLNRLWPQEGIGVPVVRLILEKVPLAALSMLSSAATVIAAKSEGAIAKVGALPISYCISNALVSYCGYIWKMFRPVGLAIIYPHPTAGIPGWSVAISVTVLLTVTILVILMRRRRYLPVGWLWYLVTLIPVIGFVQVGRQTMADRFTYIPMTGLFIMLVWFTCGIVGKWRNRTYLIGFAGSAVLCVLGIMTFRQVGYWRDTMTLFTYTAAVTKDNYIAYSLLGARYAHNGDFDRASVELAKVMKLNVKEIDVLYNVANGLAAIGKTDKAIEYYNKILAIAPGDTDTYIAFAIMETGRGNFDRAEDLYRKGLQYHPESGDLHGRLGSLFLQRGKVDEAIAELETAVKLMANSGIYGNLGMALLSKGQTERATECYQRAIRIDPANAEAHYNLGNVYLAMERPAEAAGEFEKAIKAKPNYAKAYGNLGVAFLQTGQTDRAIEGFRRAVGLDHNSVEAHFNLAMTIAGKGLIDEAIEHFRKVIELVPQNTTVHCRLAELLLVQGKVEQATAEYEQVLKIDPADDEAKAALEKIKTGNIPSGAAPVK